METSPGLLTAAAGAPMHLADVDVGNTANAGRFFISGSGFDLAKRVVISPAPAPFAGKGILADESEMDAITVVGHVLDALTIECFWHAIPGPIRGHFNFQYRLADP